MPTRRTTLLGLGLLTAGGAGAAATGAFTAATAERTVTVTTGDETDAIIAFQPTSAHASITDEQLQVDFENLNANANFTFEDTFIIVNNSTETVALNSVESAGDEPNWLNEDDGQSSTSNIGVLIGESVNTWQGTPNGEYIGSNVDPDVDGNTDGGYYDFDGNQYTTGAIELAPPADENSIGDWVSIGFQFGNSEIGDWDNTDFPGTLRFEFGQVSGQ